VVSKISIYLNRFKETYGTWALVAGAAEGLGEAFSTVLAEQGMNLVMADNSPASLEKLGVELENKHGIRTLRLALDLSSENAWEQCISAMANLDCRLLVYTAAYSHVTPFVNHAPDVLDRFINVNARTVLHLVHGFVDRFTAQRVTGGILLMASLAGMVSPPLLAPYAATKAFNIKLAESLYHELKPRGILISACISGVITTPRFWESKPVFGTFKPRMMSARSVAEFSLRNLGKKPGIMPGWQNRLSYFLLTRLLPSSLSLKIVAGTMLKMYPSGSAGQ
jgi:short-subunit dehydrogenase